MINLKQIWDNQSIRIHSHMMLLNQYILFFKWHTITIMYREVVVLLVITSIPKSLVWLLYFYNPNPMLRMHVLGNTSKIIRKTKISHKIHTFWYDTYIFQNICQRHLIYQYLHVFMLCNSMHDPNTYFPHTIVRRINQLIYGHHDVPQGHSL